MPPAASPTSSPCMNKSIHLPGLNGLRAIAALSVMWGHTFQKDFGDWGTRGIALPFVADGVTLFFVISGFLITYLLLHEQEKSQTINIPKFYMRRILRIWPIYYLYLIIAITVSGLWGDPTLWYYGFFAANIPFILTIGLWPVVHYWSIGVEEQFYLFWPWLVRIAKGTTKRLITISIIVCSLWLAAKYGSYLISGHSTVYRFFAVTRFDCMMIGAIGAILYFKKHLFYTKLTTNRWVGVASLMLLLFSQLWAGIIPAPIRPQAIAILSLFAIMSQLVQKPLINLENRICDFVGKISYGIYVIHPLLIFLLSGLYRNAGLQMSNIVASIIIYALVTSATIFLAWLSYRFFESPFLRLKNRFAIVKSQNSMKQ